MGDRGETRTSHQAPADKKPIGDDYAHSLDDGHTRLAFPGERCPYGRACTVHYSTVRRHSALRGEPPTSRP